MRIYLLSQFCCALLRITRKEIFTLDLKHRFACFKNVLLVYKGGVASESVQNELKRRVICVHYCPLVFKSQ